MHSSIKRCRLSISCKGNGRAPVTVFYPIDLTSTHSEAQIVDPTTEADAISSEDCKTGLGSFAFDVSIRRTFIQTDFSTAVSSRDEAMRHRSNRDTTWIRGITRRSG
jgi:hypothetical protein